MSSPASCCGGASTKRASRRRWRVSSVVGKFVGILGASTLAVRTRLGALPPGTGLHHVAGVAVLGGIGFTVSLFITDLAFRGEMIDDAKIGVLAASAVAAVLGLIVLRVLLRGPVPAFAPESGEGPT